MKHSGLLRTIGLSLVCAAATVTATAQDVIFKRDGDEIQAKVIRVGSVEIDYKKWSNQDGPTYSVNKSEVFIIKYANGEKDVFKEEPAPAARPAQEAETGAEPKQAVGELAKTSPENEAYIRSINEIELPPMPEQIKKKDKRGEYYMAVWGIGSNSVMETDEIKAEIKIHETSSGKVSYRHIFYVQLSNKTGSAIYIDRALSAAGSNSYYNPDVITETTTSGENKSTGVGVNLGGVASALGVGGVVGGVASAIDVGGNRGSHNGTVSTRTLASDRFSVIPAMSSFDLKRDKWVEETKYNVIIPSIEKKTGKHIKTELYEYLDVEVPNIGNVDIYNEGNSCGRERFVISYSTDPNFATYKTLVFDVYVRAVYGLPNSGSKKMCEYLESQFNFKGGFVFSYWNWW